MVEKIETDVDKVNALGIGNQKLISVFQQTFPICVFQDNIILFNISILFYYYYYVYYYYILFIIIIIFIIYYFTL